MEVERTNNYKYSLTAERIIYVLWSWISNLKEIVCLHEFPED